MARADKYTKPKAIAQIKVTNQADHTIIDIEGVIGVPEEWQFDSPDARVATYEKFRAQIAAIAEIENSEIVINIRSSGGDVQDALLIYEELIALGATITTRCYGYVASAATIIAQAASEGKREISPSALYLIHQAIACAKGNSSDLRGRIELLDKTNSVLAGLYARRSGRSAEEFIALMAEENGNGRWLSPEEAISSGLCDCLITTQKTSNPQNMSKPKKTAQGDKKSFTERVLAKIETILNSEGSTPQNYEFMDGEGNLLFTSENETASLAEGDVVILPDGATSGTFTLQDGRVVEVSYSEENGNSYISDIEEAGDSQEVTDLRNQVAEQGEQLETASTEIQNLRSEVGVKNQRIAELEGALRDARSVITSNYTPPGRTSSPTTGEGDDCSYETLRANRDKMRRSNSNPNTK